MFFSHINATVAKVNKRNDNLIQKCLAYKYGPNTGEIQYNENTPKNINVTPASRTVTYFTHLAGFL